jgi:pimeloyl-ACP methyl ester carboxylesterase
MATTTAIETEALPVMARAERRRGVIPRVLFAGWLAASLIASLGQTPGVASANAGPTVAPSAGELPRRQVLMRAVRADPSLEYRVYVPGRGGRDAPIFVTVHGVSRNVDEHAGLFAPFAERYGVVLVAPSFTAQGHHGYQRLEADAGGRGADQDLESIVAEVASLTGARAGSLYLFGFSGGAQFVHRFVLAHPERVAAAAVGSPGWYTFPDTATAYPYGLGPGPGSNLSAPRFDPDRFLRVPIHVFVGGADTLGGENLRRNPELDRQQGTTRRERARRWVAAMRQAATARGLEPRVTGDQVPGIGHSFRQFMQDGGLGERVFQALFGSPAAGGTP